MKIKIHSAVDLITNSSTVIFTYQDNCINTLKDMVNEMLKAFNVDLTFDDLFYADIFLDNFDYYEEYNKEELNINELIKQILIQKIIKPEWMQEAEKSAQCYDGYRVSNSLHLQAKDKKHKILSDKILKFLNSSINEACYNG